MAASHQVREKGTGTSNTLRLEAAGGVAVLLGPVLRVAIRHALRKENAGLKAHCEALLDRSARPC
jgi:hypothetical protein